MKFYISIKDEGSKIQPLYDVNGNALYIVDNDIKNIIPYSVAKEKGIDVNRLHLIVWKNNIASNNGYDIRKYAGNIIFPNPDKAANLEFQEDNSETIINLY